MTHDKTNLADRLMAAPGGYARHEHQHIGGAMMAADLIGRMSLKPGMAILDAGCGVGATIRQMADLGLGPLFGLDRDVDFIMTARDLCYRTERGAGAQFICGDALRMPYKASQFDAVITVHTSMMIADASYFYAEIARVLKPGSVLGVLDITAGSGGGDIAFPMPWADTRGQSFLLSPDDLCAQMERAGFQITAVIDKTAEAEKIVADAVDKRFASVLLGSDGRARVENLHHALANRGCGLTMVLAHKNAL